jgi:hypothetical protein
MALPERARNERGPKAPVLDQFPGFYKEFTLRKEKFHTILLQFKMKAPIHHA